MRNITPWKAYPMFRLTIPLVAGIFLSDTFFHGALSLRCFFVGIGLLLLGLLGISVWQRYAFRWWFGSFAFLFLFCLGALLVQHKRQRVICRWPAERAIYKGVIVDAPQAKEKTYICKMKVETQMAVESINAALPIAGEAIPLHRTILLYVAKDSLAEKLQCGDRLVFYTRVSQPQSIRGLGEFDYAAYLLRQQISGTAVVFSGYWHAMGGRVPLNLKQKAGIWREKIVQWYRDWGFSGDEFAVLSALTVGYKEELSEELRDTYQAAGVSHVLALSGMHVAVLWGLLSWLMRPLNKRRPLRCIKCFFLILLLWGFAFLVGLTPSVVRAVVMCMLMTLAQASGRRALSLNTLAVAAFFMLVYNPFYLFDVGFQLSFLAVLSILMIYPVWPHYGMTRLPALRYVWEVVTVSLSAQVGTAPLTICYFARFPIYFLLANLMVAPLAFLIIYGAVIVFLFSFLPVIQVWVVKGLNGLLWLLNNSMHWVEHLPGAEWGNIHFSVSQVVLLYTLLFLLLGYRLWHSRKLVVMVLMVANLFVCIGFYRAWFYKKEEQLVFARAQVMNYPAGEMWQQDYIYRYKGVTICVLADNRWRNKQADNLLDIDYMYLCKGYQGKVAPLQKVFHIKKIILDASLSDYKMNLLKEECEGLGLDYIDISQKGSFRILL